MIQLTAQMRILVAVEPADFRCGIDGLALIIDANTVLAATVAFQSLHPVCRRNSQVFRRLRVVQHS